MSGMGGQYFLEGDIQCCREITFILNRLYRDISRYEHLIAIYQIIHDQLSLDY